MFASLLRCPLSSQAEAARPKLFAKIRVPTKQEAEQGLAMVVESELNNYLPWALVCFLSQPVLRAPKPIEKTEN